MKLISVYDIKVSPNRQRQEFDLAELTDLGVSIKERGLLQAIILREESDELILVAGERRLRAVKDLYETGECTELLYDAQVFKAPNIPYVTLGELDELERAQAEYEENTKRANLTWQEQANATTLLAALQEARAKKTGAPPPTVATVATELHGDAEGRHYDDTRKQLLVSKHLADPEVKGAKNLDEAFKVLKRKEDVAKRVQLAAEVGRTYTADTAHRVEHCDSLQWLAACAEGQFDVICTDPPYGIGADEFGDSGGKAAGAHFYEDNYENWEKIIRTLAAEGFRVTKPQAHLYCFCDITRFEEAKDNFEVAGWKVFRTPIIWHKPNGSRLPWLEQGPQRKYEIILYAVKGDKKVTRIYPDLVSYPSDANLGHQAQKPVALFEDLLKRSVAPGDSVLDPFAGSGPILVSGHTLKCKVTALEQDAAAYALCLKRLDALKGVPDLPGLE